jgi:hypothetical protein
MKLHILFLCWMTALANLCAANDEALKIACDILAEYEETLPDMNILEIGTSDTLEKIFCSQASFKSYTLISASDLDLTTLSNYDLVISNHGIDKHAIQLIDNIPHGYLLMNFNPKGKLNVEELAARCLNTFKKGSIQCKSFRKGNQSKKDIHDKILRWRPANEIRSTLRKESRSAPRGSTVTYSLSGGRLGDNIISFLHALWISKKYDMPLICKTFTHSEQFAFSRHYPQYKEIKNHDSIITVFKESDIFMAKQASLFVIPYHPEARDEYETKQFLHTMNFQLDAKDPEFREAMLRDLSPIASIQTQALPKDRLTVALHVRRGGKHEDYNYHRYVTPLKHPPEEYYIDALKTLQKIYPHELIYVQIFTDDEDPNKIMAQFSEHFKRGNVIFDTHKNSGSNAVLNDLFSMSKFDCLIRSQSNLSIVSELIGNHELVIYPIGYRLEGYRPIIDQVEMTIYRPPISCNLSQN